MNVIPSKARWLLSVIVSAAALTTFAAPVKLGPEVPVSPPALGAAPYEQSDPRIASNGTDFVAVWTDGRSGDSAYTDPLIFVAHLDADGVVTSQYPLATGYLAVIASDGTNYLVVYSSATGLATQQLDARGNKVGSPHSLAGQLPLDLASNGSSYLLIDDRGSLQSETLTLLDLSGNVLRTSETTLRVARGGIAVRNGSYVLATADRSDCTVFPCTQPLTIAVVDSSGAMVSRRSIGVALDNVNRSIAAAFADNEILIAWSRNPATSDPTHAAFVLASFDGALLAAEKSLPVPFTDYVTITAGWDGTQFAIGSTANDIVQLTRITAAGDVVDLVPLQLGLRRGNAPSMASAGKTTGLIWSEQRFATSDIFVDALPRFGDLSSNAVGTLASISAPAQLDPVVVAERDPHVVVWNTLGERRAVDAAIGTSIVNLTQSDTLYLPNIFAARGDRTFLTGWLAASGIGYRLVDFEGRTSEPHTLDGPFNWQVPAAAAAFNGSSYVVAHTRSAEPGLVADFIDESGAMSHGPTSLLQSTTGDIFTSASAILAGSNFMVAASGTLQCPLDFWKCGLPPTRIWVTSLHGLTATETSQPLYSAGDSWFGSDLGNAHSISTATDSSRTSIAWIESKYANESDFTIVFQISALALDTAGRVVIGPKLLVPPSSDRRVLLDAKLAWDGNEYVLVWIESDSYKPSRVAVLRLDRDLNALDSEPIVVADQLRDLHISASPSPDGIVVAYSRLDETLGVPRVFTRTLDRIEWTPRRRAASH